MDVNELNKMNVVAQFNKLISQTNFIGSEGESFAGILEKNASELPFATTKNESASQKEAVKSPVNEKKEEVFAKEKPENKAEKENKVDKEKPTKEKEDVEAKDNSADKDNKIEKEDDVEKEKRAKASMQVPVLPLQVVCPEGTASLESVTAESDMVSALKELPKGMLSKDMQIIDENGNIFSIDELPLQELSSQDSFKILNAQTMEEVEVNGAQLAQIITELSSDIADNMAEIAPVIENVAENMPSSEKKMQNQKLESSEPSLLDETTALEQNLTEGNPLDELIADKSVKIDVTVKEEKISYAENKSLVKDALVLQEVAKNGESLQEEQPVSQQAPQAKATSGNANLTINAASSQNMAMVAEENTQTTQNIAITEVKQASSTSNTSQAIVTGSEFLASAKAENSGKSNQTTLSDVYKGMSKEAVEQVKVNITKSAVKGVDTIEVRLKPEELGHIEIKMQIKNGKLQAHIISSRPETMEALQRDAQVLEKAFNEAGFQTDSNSLSFSFRNEGNQAQEQSNQLRNFIGKVFEQEANSDVAAAEAANQNWSAENGLNIRV